MSRYKHDSVKIQSLYENITQQPQILNEGSWFYLRDLTTQLDYAIQDATRTGKFKKIRDLINKLQTTVDNFDQQINGSASTAAPEIDNEYGLEDDDVMVSGGYTMERDPKTGKIKKTKNPKHKGPILVGDEDLQDDDVEISGGKRITRDPKTGKLKSKKIPKSAANIPYSY